MLKTAEYSGKTEEDAVSAALLDLGLDRDEVSVEIIERAKSGFLGIGASPAVIRITFEAEDSQIESVRNFLTGLLSHMGAVAEIEITETEEDGISVALSGSDMGAVIGRRGETLDAIQHLTNYAMNRGMETRKHISVDAENYRKKREESLVSLAEKVAGKVVKYRRNLSLEPMNSYERLIIHTALQNFEGVSTNSVGSEPNRRVVVSFVGAARKTPYERRQ